MILQRRNIQQNMKRIDNIVVSTHYQKTGNVEAAAGKEIRISLVYTSVFVR